MASPLSASAVSCVEQDDEQLERAMRVPESQRRKEKNKVIAASLGAVITSLTMTPFDVVKFRLQAQDPSSAPQLFVPSSSLPPPTQSLPRPSNSPWPPPIASTSTATCCQKTYFNANSTNDLACKFDPRVTTSTLPSSGLHGAASAQLNAAAPSHSIRPLPHLLPSLATQPSSSATCIYPSASAAALSLPSQTSTSVSSSKHLSGFWDAVAKIAKHEGLPALWRGTVPALAMSVPGQVIYMVGYDWGRRTALQKAPEWAYTRSSSRFGFERKELSTAYMTAVPLIAGSISRTVVAAIVSPVELFRTRLQTTTALTSVSSIIKSIKADGGWTAAWRGLPMTLWRDVPFSGIYWAGYEGIKRSLTGGQGMGEGWKEQNAWEEFRVSFISGAGSGMIAATLTNPFDVVKTRRQALSSTSSAPSATKTFAILFDVAKKEGWAGLMRGLTPRLAKVGPACGIMIGCYEGVGSWLE